MPEPTGDQNVPVTTVPEPPSSDGLFDALSGMLRPESPLNPQRETLDFDSDDEWSGPSTSVAATETTGSPASNIDVPEPAGAGTEQPADAITEDSPDNGPVEAPDGEPVEPEPQLPGETPEQQASRKKRGALLTQREQERDEARKRAEEAERERDDFKRRWETAQREAQPVDDSAARAEILEFIGLKPPVDEQGNPTGDEPAYRRLDRLAKGRGFEYEDEQREYAELSARQEMTGRIYAVARRAAFSELAGDLVDPDVGIDQDAVNKAGSIRGWKAAYRAALDRSLEDRITAAKTQSETEVSTLKSDYEDRLKKLQDQLAAAERKLAERPAAYQSQLARAQQRRSPVGAGRSVGPSSTATRPTPNGYPGYSGMADLINDLSSGLEESERAAGR